MLRIKISGGEFYNERDNEFIQVRPAVLELEHSLISISKWEAKWHQTFLSKKPKTFEQWISYIACMTINANVDPLIYQCITQADIDIIQKYIDDPMTAIYHVSEKSSGGKKSKDAMVSELIYCSMIAYGIPFECQKWHLNRLLSLIDVCDKKFNNNPKRKHSKTEMLRERAELNAERRKRLNTTG